MSDVYKISQALEDMKNYYGLKEIKNVTLNMNDVEDVHITFVSNKPTNNLFNDMEGLPDKLTYVLKLSINVGSVFPEE